ncbi:MAG: ABC transporter permease [Betaproteobacteria bacterium RBG_16_64_18]|nr:MAG: ABC transporter permease [Betaproteobacteria bacterium RBG_16_64_18]OGA16772.1 MAG: ABC transporter permease [Betaproteobacteria bacterium RIFCSPLOWO2_02_FULL_65_20]OGA39862.1 MAG: ABC transporter permease [Betaproteobacteria bacterium RIFCSPLOWO2_12_FULL_65_110]
MLLQILANALALGAAYALLALGFVLILNATGAVNFAHGDMVMAGGYVAIAMGSVLQLPGALLLPLVVAVMALLGFVFSWFAYFPLKNRPPVSVFISTIALGIIFQNSANAIYGAAPRKGPPLLSEGNFGMGGITIGAQALGIVVVAIVLIVAQHLLLNRSGIGRKLRATAQDREMAEAVGIRVNRMIALTFALGSALAGAAGLMLSNTFFITPTDGTNYVIKAYIAVTIGGWGSLSGAVCGALIIALFEVLFPSLPLLIPPLKIIAPWLFTQTASTILLYVGLLAIMFFRPQGLFGETVQRRV